MRKNNLRITIINRCYWPDTEATGQLLTELCESLACRHDVTVIAGQPNVAPSEGEDTEYIHSGVQVRNGVRILRVRHTQWPKHRTWSRLANLASFTLAARKLLYRQPTPDLVVSETDPFFLPMITARYAQRAKIPFVAYLQDIYPDVAIAVGKARENYLVSKLRNRLKRAYQTAERIIVLSPSMKDRLVGWGGIDADRIRIIPNWIDTETVFPWQGTNRIRDEFSPSQSEFVVMHSGNMGLTQPLDSLIQSTASEEFPKDGKLVLVGSGCREAEWKQLAKDVSPNKVVFRGYAPRHQLAESLSACDLHVIASDPRVNGCLAPSKLYGILAAGRPTLVIGSRESDAAKYVCENGVGCCVEPVPEKIALAIRNLRRDREILQVMGMRARRLAEDLFDKRIVVDQLVEQFESAAIGWETGNERRRFAASIGHKEPLTVGRSVTEEASSISDSTIGSPF